MKSDKYKVTKEIEKFKKLGYTGFINRNMFLEVSKILRSCLLKYDIYETYKDADKIILYSKEPNVTCFKIISGSLLKHSDIMGALYNFQVSEDVIGDIIVDDNNYYFYILSSMEEYFSENFKMIGNNNISIKKIDLPDYERKYDVIELISSSERIDAVISKLTNIKRTDIDSLISKKAITLNYNVLTNKSYNLKEDDIFSIKGYGKYKYIGIIRTTKKDNLILKILKYI